MFLVMAIFLIVGGIIVWRIIVSKKKKALELAKAEIEKLKQNAQQGDVNAQFELGHTYLNVSEKERINWLAMAADGGHEGAKKEIADIIERGINTSWHISYVYVGGTITEPSNLLNLAWRDIAQIILNTIGEYTDDSIHYEVETTQKGDIVVEAEIKSAEGNTISFRDNYLGACKYRGLDNMSIHFDTLSEINFKLFLKMPPESITAITNQAEQEIISYLNEHGITICHRQG